MPERPSWRRWWPGQSDHAARRAAERLYDELVKQARTPVFYRDLGVPDTPEGRFEVVGLHAALLLRHLRAAGATGRAVGQALFDRMFADMDESLRQLGIGDLSVGKYVKRLARNFYARIAALDEALDEALAKGGTAPFEPLLQTNVYHGGPKPSAAQLRALACYLIEVDHALAERSPTPLLQGDVVFHAPLAPDRTGAIAKAS